LRRRRSGTSPKPAEQQVDPAFVEQANRIHPPGRHDAKGHVRRRLDKTRDQRRQPCSRRVIGRRYAEAADRLRWQEAAFFQGVKKTLHARAHLWRELERARGGLHTGRARHEQFVPERVAQPRDRMADGRGGQTELARSGADASMRITASKA
jgi:hypothetical protein